MVSPAPSARGQAGTGSRHRTAPRARGSQSDGPPRFLGGRERKIPSRGITLAGSPVPGTEPPRRVNKTRRCSASAADHTQQTTFPPPPPARGLSPPCPTPLSLVSAAPLSSPFFMRSESRDDRLSYFPVDAVVPFGVSWSTKYCSCSFVSCGRAVLRPSIFVLLSIRSTRRVFSLKNNENLPLLLHFVCWICL